MTSTDLEMFLDKLRMLVYENYYTSWIGNNRLIQERKPEIRLLYEELGSCFMNIELEDVGNLKRRLMVAAHEAEDTLDLFLSSAIINNDFEHSLLEVDQDWINQNMTASFFEGIHIHQLRYPQTMTAPVFIDNVLHCSLKNLKDAMDDLKSIREEIMTNNNIANHQDSMMLMMDDKFEATGTSRVNLSATEHEDLIVGFEEDALLMLDRLTGHRKKLEIISIVGMGGIGKTTLATKIFNDSLVEYHFDKRGWVTVSQAYSKRDLLLQLLASIGKSVHEATSESKLSQMLYQSLKGIKYLIVIDDIWSCKAWEDVGRCFPDDNTGSRVLLTTRLTEVALYTSQGGFTHNLGHLTEDQSWELLCRKTFRGHECPERLIKTGKRIAKKCGGLPLALVVIAGLLEKGGKRKDLWEKIAKSVGSYIINDPKGCLHTLALSYDHLPSHLKKCFLYTGGFPEDYKIQVRRLIRLWIAEGFIKESGQRSLEEEGEYYLMDLIDRNLLIVADKGSNGGIKSCRLHDLLRELCLKKASEEDFFKKASIMSISNNNPFSDSASRMVKQRCLFADYEVLCKFSSHEFATYTRSVLCLHDNQLLGYKTTSWVLSFLLLRVLDLQNIPMVGIGKIRMLVHLRYLAVWLRCYQSSFSEASESPFSEAKFGGIQTLIVKGKFQSFLYSPGNLVNLRHLRCDQIDFSKFSSVHRRFPLQTISRLRLDHRAQRLLECFPDIKKLGCSISSASSNHGLLSFPLLTHLEALNIDKYMSAPLTLANPIRFPETLKRLTLKGLRLPWSHMSTIQLLPKLEVLKLLDSSFTGHLWETGDEQFQQLKYLKLEKLNIHVWKASSINFPRLRKLVLKSCENLKKIPQKLGNSFTLEHIEIDSRNSCVCESVNRIQEARHENENYDIHVNFTHMDPSEVYFEGDPFYD